MSRIGKQPISIPSGVKVSCTNGLVTVEGPKGRLSEQIEENSITLSLDKDVVEVKRASDSKRDRAMHGLYRALIANMVTGVSDGFSRPLEIEGVGYRVEKAGKALTFHLGYSHPISVLLPEGVDVKLEGATKLTVFGIDKQKVGQVAANIRSLRPPEPYKGKGVRYVGEYIRRKAGKTAGA